MKHSLVVLLISIVCAFPISCHNSAQSSNSDNQNEPLADWEEPLEIASGDAYRGPWEMNDSQWHFVDDPTVAINDNNVTAVAWANNEEQDIYLQLYEPDGSKRFDEPVNVSRSSSVFSWLPRLVIGPGNGDDVWMLWQDIIFSGGSHGGEIIFAKSDDGGHSFSQPVNLSQTTAGAGKGRISSNYWHNGSLDLEVDDEGTVYTAWTEYEGRLWFRRSDDGGQSFSEPLQVAGAEGTDPARGPAIARTSDEEIYLAWTAGDESDANIHIAHSSDSGDSFNEPEIIRSDGFHADAPKLATDREGNIHLVYAEGSEGPFGAYSLRYTVKRSVDNKFREPETLKTLPDEKFSSSHFPYLQIDSEDRLYLLWELFPEPGENPAGLGFSVSDDKGQTFKPPQLIPGSYDPGMGFSGSQQGLLMSKMAVNSGGEIAVVNSTFQQNDASKIWLYRGR